MSVTGQPFPSTRKNTNIFRGESEVCRPSAGFVRVTAGRLRVAQYVQPQAPFKPHKTDDIRRAVKISERIAHGPSLPRSEAPRAFGLTEPSSAVDSAVIAVRATSMNSACPCCGADSDRVHSRYPRRLGDLPIAGRRAVLMLQARRFRCEAVLCERRIFAERFNDNILKPWARRTAQLDQIVHCLALALGGRPAASFARRLSIQVSNDTLLRAVRKRGNPELRAPGDQWDRRLGLASQRSLWNADL